MMSAPLQRLTAFDPNYRADGYQKWVGGHATSRSLPEYLAND